jgi:hypothetical protein
MGDLQTSARSAMMSQLCHKPFFDAKNQNSLACFEDLDILLRLAHSLPVLIRLGAADALT